MGLCSSICRSVHSLTRARPRQIHVEISYIDPDSLAPREKPRQVSSPLRSFIEVQAA
jgi:hypothetical protein